MRTDKITITITEAALEAIQLVLDDPETGADDVLHLSVDAEFQNELFVGPVEPGEVVVRASGIPVAMDKATIKRADGLKIDFTETGDGEGFKLDNPNAAPQVRPIRPMDFVRLLMRGDSLEFIDARTAEERALSFVEQARLLDDGYIAEILEMPKGRKLVFMGHHGRHGQAVAQRYFEEGFTDVWYVSGGIDAWSTMDPDVPRYGALSR